MKENTGKAKELHKVFGLLWDYFTKIKEDNEQYSIANMVGDNIQDPRIESAPMTIEDFNKAFLMFIDELNTNLIQLPLETNRAILKKIFYPTGIMAVGCSGAQDVLIRENKIEESILLSNYMEKVYFVSSLYDKYFKDGDSDALQEQKNNALKEAETTSDHREQITTDEASTTETADKLHDEASTDEAERKYYKKLLKKELDKICKAGYAKELPNGVYKWEKCKKLLCWWYCLVCWYKPYFEKNINDNIDWTALKLLFGIKDPRKHKTKEGDRLPQGYDVIMDILKLEDYEKKQIEKDYGTS